MKTFFLKVLMWIQIGVSQLIDNIFNLFSVFSGIDTVQVAENGSTKEVSLLMYFMTNKTVISVFWTILVLGVALAMIFTVVSVVKNMVVIKKTSAKILGQMLLSIVSMILVVMLLFAFIFGANCILGEINTAFNQDNNLTFSQKLFEASVGDAWANVTDAAGNETENKHNMESIFGVDENGELRRDWKEVTPDKIFGKKPPNLIGMEDESADFITGKDPMVDINKYDFFIGLPASIIVCVVVFMAIMGLIVRLYDLVFILLTSPLVMSTVPLDDGAKFKLWRETAVSKTLLAYGTIFAANIYLILMPIITTVRIPGKDALTTLSQVLLIVCGALTISNGQVFFARLLGTSAEESRQAAHGFRAMFAGVMGTAKTVSGAGRMVFGTYNPYTHRRERGILGRARSGASKVGYAGATVLFGGSADSVGYRSNGERRNRLSAALRQKWHDRGGVEGMLYNSYQKRKDPLNPKNRRKMEKALEKSNRKRK